MCFHLKLPEGWIFSKVKTSDIVLKRLTKFGRNKVLRIKPRAAVFVVRFANYKSRALSHEPSSDCVIARAKVRVRTQASYGNQDARVSRMNHNKLTGS